MNEINDWIDKAQNFTLLAICFTCIILTVRGMIRGIPFGFIKFCNLVVLLSLGLLSHFVMFYLIKDIISEIGKHGFVISTIIVSIVELIGSIASGLLSLITIALMMLLLYNES